jgi:hypothetical protein
VPSRALARWSQESRAALDALDAAHARVAATRRVGRALAQPIAHAYLVAVAAQFQRYCRDLHSEAAQRLADAVEPRAFRGTVLRLLTEGRRLDAGNATAGALGADFDRLGLELLAALEASAPGRRLIRELERLHVWRNAIVHQDFTLKPGRAKLVRGTAPEELRHVRRWRASCDALAGTLDALVRAHVSQVVGGAPWR